MTSRRPPLVLTDVAHHARLQKNAWQASVLGWQNIARRTRYRGWLHVSREYPPFRFVSDSTQQSHSSPIHTWYVHHERGKQTSPLLLHDDRGSCIKKDPSPFSLCVVFTYACFCLEQHVPAWKLEGLARNMAVTFAYEGDDASWACTDPSFSYFLVTGSLAPVEITPNRLSASLLTPTPLHYAGATESLRETPSDELAASDAQLRPDRCEHTVRLEAQPNNAENGATGGVHHPVVYGVQIPGTARSSGDKSSSIGGSTWSPAALRKDGGLTTEHGSGGSDIESTLGGGIFSTLKATLSEVNASDVDSSSHEGEETPSLLPGQSLDCYLLPHRVKIVDPEGDLGKPVSPEVVPDAAERAGTTRWKLEARQASCIGRVSLRFLRELEREEAKHETEVKVAFLRQTEVSEGNVHRRKETAATGTTGASHRSARVGCIFLCQPSALVMSA